LRWACGGGHGAVPAWADPRLTDAQLVYAANDAYAAIRVFYALGRGR
jgi:hypothetical protein